MPIPDNFRVYTIGAPDWDCLGELLLRDLRQRYRLIFHQQFNLAGADLAPALWLTYIDPTKTLNDVETAV